MEIRSKFNVGDIVYYGSWDVIEKFKVTDISLIGKEGIRYSNTKSVLGNWKEKYCFKSLKEAKDAMIKEAEKYFQDTIKNINNIKEEDIELCK